MHQEAHPEGSRISSRPSRLWRLLALSVLAAASSAHAKIDGITESAVTFTALGPAGLKIVGNGSGVTIDDDGKALVFRFPLRTLTTGIALRDQHMHEKYLQDQSYPTAELNVAREGLKLPAANQSTSGDAGATLALHGKKKNVRVHYEIARSGRSYRVTASMPLDIRDFGIEIPSYLGVTVKPAVDVKVTFSATGSIDGAAVSSLK